jgi:hypothetical protein
VTAEIPSGLGVLQRIQEAIWDELIRQRDTGGLLDAPSVSRDGSYIDGEVNMDAVAAAVLASVNPNITTQEQLDALPHLALLLRPYQSQAGWNLHEVWEKRGDVWHCLAAPLSPPARHDGVPLLPAILLWSPS